MLLEELIEKAFSDGYEYALEEQREFAYSNGMIGTGIGSGLAKKSLAPSSKSADMWAKVRSKNPADWSKTRASALEAAKAKVGKKIDPMAAERAKVSFPGRKVSRPAELDWRLHEARRAQRAGNPFSRNPQLASQLLAGPGGMR
jgi:hypothetical protein